MPTTRVIPCLDVKDGSVVKGVRFLELEVLAEPVSLAERYYREGADEIAFLDISATNEGRTTLLECVEKTAANVFVPLLVGGGIRSLDEARRALRSGADKVSVNTAAVQNPLLISELRDTFGSQCVVVSVDAKREPGVSGKWNVYTHGGKSSTSLDAVTWARRAVELGAGEILLTSIDRDGTSEGYDIELLKQVCSSVPVPVIASGGAGTPEDAARAVLEAGADAVLAASVFHYGRMSIGEFKQKMREMGVKVR